MAGGGFRVVEMGTGCQNFFSCKINKSPENVMYSIVPIVSNTVSYMKVAKRINP